MVGVYCLIKRSIQVNKHDLTVLLELSGGSAVVSGLRVKRKSAVSWQSKT